MNRKIDPIRPIDDEARGMARDVLNTARHAAIGVIHPDNGAPHVTRIALARVDAKNLVSLVSDLSLHSAALKKAPDCSLLVGIVPAKGDPLAFPRLTLSATAHFLDDGAKAALKSAYLGCQPKAKLYYEFGDFRLVRFEVTSADLNGGFGKAYRLTTSDLIE